MPAPRNLQRLEALIWVLLYGGLLCLVLGIATARIAPDTGWALMVAGALAAAGGVGLIVVRARQGDGAPPP